MKILLIHNYYRYRGGEDRYVRILEDTLTQKTHQVIHFFYDSRSIEHFSLFQKWLIPIKLINSKSINRKLEDFLIGEKPDLAVVHNLSPLLSLSILEVLKRNRVPILKRLENYKFLCLNGLFLRNNFKVCEKCIYGNFFHGILFRCYQHSFFNSMGIAISEWIHRRKKTLTSAVDLFLATSQFVKTKYVQAGFPGDKIVVYPNFINFEPVEFILKPELYAIYIGRLSTEKGLLTLLKAFKGLPDLPLKILGNGPFEKELKKYIHTHKMKNVEFAGFVDGELKREILARARFLIFSSECYESFGYSIIESYACGIPVIASDMGGARELIKEGDTGFLFVPGNSKDLQKQVSRMLEIDEKNLMSMKKKSLKLARELYTKEGGYKNILKVFESLQRGREERR